MSMISNETVSKNFIWRLLERCGAQIVTFVVSIVLARLLDPSVYGEIALVTVFISILQVFVDGGLGNALIQKKDADNVDFSSVFFFNIIFCIILYGLMYLIAPFISAFYDKELTSVIRVLSIVIIISGVKNVQQAYVSRNMMFKKFFFATLGGTIGASVIGVVLALKGFGVWALVYQYLFNNVVDTLLLWITVKWRPICTFSFDRLKGLFSFGWKLLLAQLFDSVYENCRSLIIGKKYSAASLAYYNKGKQFPSLILTNISSSMDSVLLPTMSTVQDDKKLVRNMLSRSIKLSAFVIFPLLFGLSGISKLMVKILLTEKWGLCVPYMNIFCIAMIFTPLSLSNLNAIKAIGNSGVYLKLEITRKIFGILTLIIFMWFGPIYIAFSYLLNQIIGYFINTLATKKVLDYGPIKQLKDIFLSLLGSVFMLVFVWSIGKISINKYFLVILQIMVGMISYVFFAYITHNESFHYILMLFKTLLKQREKDEKI